MGMHHDVFIDGQPYAVADGTEMDTVRAEVLDAVRTGGAFVSFGQDRTASTEVLITAATAVRIEHKLVAEDRAERPTDSDPGDPDWWL